RQQAEAANPPGEEAIARVRALLGDAAPAANTHSPRQFVEHVAVLDTLRATDVEDVRGWLTGIGDGAGAERLLRAAAFARDSLGIVNLRVVDDFPIALCAVGFTRITRDPARSVLSPFETNDTEGRTPLYVV